MNPVETGLFYLNSRYYDPETGRFINADAPETLGLPNDNILGYNLFAYCVNNPVMNIDSTGYFYQEIGITSSSKILDGFARRIDSRIYSYSNNWFKSLLYGTGNALIGSISKFNIGKIYTIISVVWGGVPKINNELGAIRYAVDKIRYKYSASKYKYEISLLFGTHHNQFRLRVKEGNKVVSTTIITFRHNAIYNILRGFLVAEKVSLSKSNVEWGFYYK